METETIKMPLVKYSITDAAISELKKNYHGLTIAKDGMKAVHDARMIIKNKRVEVEKTRKALKADSLEYGRMVDSEAKRISTELESIENPLEAEENAEAIRLQAIKDEEKRLADLKLNSRISGLAQYGAAHDISSLMTMPDEKYDALLADHKKAWDKAEADKLELARLQKEEANRKAFEEKKAKEAEMERQIKESERISAERKELEKRKAEQAEAQAKQEEINRKEREAIAQQKAEFEEKQRKAQEAERLEKAKKEAAELQKQKDKLELEKKEAARKVKEERKAKVKAGTLLELIAGIEAKQFLCGEERLNEFDLWIELKNKCK